MNETSDNPRVYVGAYAICRDPAGRLLLVRVSRGLDAGHWGMPGGGVEWGEHPDAAVLRELAEETGADQVESVRVAAVYSHAYHRSADRPHDSVHHLGLVYEVHLREFAVRFEEDGSTDRCDWFAQDEARALDLTPSGRFAVDLAWPDT